MNTIFTIKSSSRHNSYDNLNNISNVSGKASHSSNNRILNGSNVNNNSSNNSNEVDSFLKYGVHTSKIEELDNLMSHLDIWGIDVFLIDQLTMHRPLTAVTYTIFQVCLHGFI